MFTQSKAVNEETVKIRQQFKLDSIFLIHLVLGEVDMQDKHLWEAVLIVWEEIEGFSANIS